MPAKSKAQQIAMAIAEHQPSKLYARNRGLLQMSKEKLHEFAATKRKGLPKHAVMGNLRERSARLKERIAGKKKRMMARAETRKEEARV